MVSLVGFTDGWGHYKEKNVKISQNGPAYWDVGELDTLKTAINEAKTVLLKLESMKQSGQRVTQTKQVFEAMAQDA